MYVGIVAGKANYNPGAWGIFSLDFPVKVMFLTLRSRNVVGTMQHGDFLTP